MSFLDQLINKKQNLKNSKTIVTHADGRRYIDTKTGPIELEGNYGFVVDTKPDDIPACIEEYIYLGSQDCCNRDVLIKYHIKSILSIGIPAPIHFDGIDYKFVACLDLPETNLSVILNHCFDFISEQVTKHNNLLIHCNAGVSRSASIVIGYLILRYKMSYVDAYNKVRSVRGCIKPNAGFERQLKTLLS